MLPRPARLDRLVVDGFAAASSVAQVAAPMVLIRIGLALLRSPRTGVILSQVHHLAGVQSPTSV